MRLYYFQDPNGNFGDDLNPWIWNQLLPGAFDSKDERLFVGIGTLLNHRLPQADRYLVFGAGVGYGERPSLDSSWEFVCVRGPVTARVLGLPDDRALIDPGILAADLFARRGPTRGGSGVAFMPHCHAARAGQWEEVCRRAGVRYIDPARPVEEVLAAIARSDLLLAEAMHGAIVAEGLGVPWVPVTTADHVLTSKWDDWFGSLGLVYAPVVLPATYRIATHQLLSRRVKVGAKRLLQAAGVWRAGWQRPPRRASSEAELSAAVAALQALAHGPGVVPVCADRSRVDALKQELYDRLRRFRAAEGLEVQGC